MTTCWGLSRLQQLYFYNKPAATSAYYWQMLTAVNDWLTEAAPCKPTDPEETSSSRDADVDEDRGSRRQRSKEQGERERGSRGEGKGGSFSRKAFKRLLRRVHGAMLWGGLLLVLVKPLGVWTLPGVLAFLLLDVWSPSPGFITQVARQVAARGPVGALVSVG